MAAEDWRRDLARWLRLFGKRLTACVRSYFDEIAPPAVLD